MLDVPPPLAILYDMKDMVKNKIGVSGQTIIAVEKLFRL
jgi:hypothetical protein